MLSQLDTTVSQMVRNRKYENINHKSSLLISQEMSYLWRAPTSSPVDISGSFTSKEFTVPLQYLKPGKAPVFDSICLELILHAGAALKSWLCDFLSSCLHRLKTLKIWRRVLVVKSQSQRSLWKSLTVLSNIFALGLLIHLLLIQKTYPHLHETNY